MSGAGTRGQRVYGQHGIRHSPRGSDPAQTDVWILVGDDPRVPFINGTNMAATADIPNPTPLKFRLSVGPPNDCDYDITQTNWFNHPTAINYYTDHQIEIAGDVTGVNPGDIVFVLPMEYRFAEDRPCKGHDDAGNYVPCRLLSTGEFVWGVP